MSTLTEYTQARADRAEAIKRYDRAEAQLLEARSAEQRAAAAVTHELETEVRARAAAELLPLLPAGCQVDVFDSDNGCEDWAIPLAVSVEHPDRDDIDGYGLCDAAADNYGAQADYLMEQLRETLAPYLADHLAHD